MAVKQVHAQVIIPSSGALPQDTCVNNFSFTIDDAVATLVAGATTLGADLATFYGDMQPYMNGIAKLSLMTIKWYDRSDPLPRSPFFTSAALGVADGVGAPLPSEVSLCMSFHAAIASGIHPARRRGRIFLPFLDSSENTNIHSDGAPTTTLTAALRDAGQDLMTVVNARPWSKWCVRSDIDDVSSPVVGGYVDNAWDTQRRRGTRATARNSW